MVLDYPRPLVGSSFWKMERDESFSLSSSCLIALSIEIHSPDFGQILPSPVVLTDKDYLLQ